ncbi:MAG: BMP family ABC transporter substrate-binding protein [Thermoleophilia bacterium]|nr:BMP family ABC transporter substrate-binding protein [Thermoleophilia bacterium]
MQQQRRATRAEDVQVKQPPWGKTMVAVTLVAAFALALSGCGKRGDTGGSSGGDGGDSGGGNGPKVGLVTDLGGLNDRSFNALANEGLKQAESELGAKGTVLESKSAADYEKNLGQLAQQGMDLTIGVGFLMADPIKAVSGKATESKFAIIDYSVEDLGKPANVRGLVFKEQEAGYLAGALAGMVESDSTLKGLNGKKVVSAIGGQKIPPVDKYIAGFQAGVKAFCKDCDVLVDYSQDFIDQSKCQDRANSQISKGSDIVFQVAGGCGLGALDAAKTKGVWGIGVDADQAYLGAHILTSAVKKVDVAVLDTIKSVADGSFQGGADGVYGLAEDGVGLGTIAPAAESYEAKLAPVIEDIKAGKVDIPTEPK